MPRARSATHHAGHHTDHKHAEHAHSGVDLAEANVPDEQHVVSPEWQDVPATNPFEQRARPKDSGLRRFNTMSSEVSVPDTKPLAEDPSAGVQEINTGYLLQYLNAKVQEERDGLRFPGGICLFVSFAVMVFLHADISGVSALDRFYRQMIEGTTFEGYSFTSGHKEFAEISDVPEIYRYMEDVFFPIFLHADPSATLAKDGPTELNRVLSYSRLIGGVQLQQKRKHRVQCSVLNTRLPMLAPLVDNFDCFAAYHPDDFTDDCFGPLAHGIRSPGDRESLPQGFCSDDSLEGTLFSEPIQKNGSRRLAGLQFVGGDKVKCNQSWPESKKRCKSLFKPKSLSEAKKRRKGNQSWPESKKRRKSSFKPESDGSAGTSTSASARRLRLSAKKRPKPNAASGLTFIKGLEPPDETPTFSTLFSSEGGLPAAMGKLQWLRDNNWIDLQTQKVGMSAFLLNPDLGAYMHLEIQIFFGVGGEVIPTVAIATIVAEPYQHMSVIGADFFFLFVLILNLSHFYFNVFVGIFVDGKFRRHCKTFWFWYEALTYHLGILAMMTWTVLYFRMNVVKELVHELSEWSLHAGMVTQISLPQALDRDDPKYLDLVGQMHVSMHHFLYMMGMYWAFLGAYAMLLMFGFFRGFGIQPRLAMITKTMEACIVDLSHHFILMFIFWVGFAAGGCILFGRRLFQFSSIQASLSYTMTMIFGSFEWDLLSQEFFWTGIVWFNSFAVIFYMLLMNMFMAIVMDVYGQVKVHAHSTDPIWVQLQDWASEWHSKKEWISNVVLADLVQELNELHQINSIGIHNLLSLVPGMKEEQARHIIVSAHRVYITDFELAMSMSQMCQTISVLAANFDYILSVIEIVTEQEAEDVLLEQTMAGQDGVGKEHTAEVVHRKCVKTLTVSTNTESEETAMSELHELFQERVRGIFLKLEAIARFGDDIITWTHIRTSEFTEQLVALEERLLPGAGAEVARSPPVAVSVPPAFEWADFQEPQSLLYSARPLPGTLGSSFPNPTGPSGRGAFRPVAVHPEFDLADSTE